MASGNFHAVIFGASGVAGWAVVEQLMRNYPALGVFSQVTAVVNRPLTVEESRWSVDVAHAPSLSLVSGIDLTTGGVQELVETLSTRLPEIDTVTHVFEFAYKPVSDDVNAEATINHEMLKRVVLAFERLSPRLKHVVFPGGAKAYGIHLPERPYRSPYTEDVPRDKMSLEEQRSIHYFASEDWLREQSKGKSWSWSEVHFDAAIGFSPHGSMFNLTAHWGNYLSLYAAVEGQGAMVPFPGTKEVYVALNNEAGTDIVAKMAIWCALNPEKSSSEAFNIADSAEGVSYVERWPKLAKYFGLVGVPPDTHWTKETMPIISEYIKKHQDVLLKHGIKQNKVFGDFYIDQYGAGFGFDRVLSLEKARKAGFMEERDPVEAWYDAWHKFRAAGLVL